MKDLADTLHEQGFKLGLYATAGFKAVYGQEEAWAKLLFEDWGADSANIDHSEPPASPTATRPIGNVTPYSGVRLCVVTQRYSDETAAAQPR